MTYRSKMKRDLSKRVNKALILDYIRDPNQTLATLSIKHGYKDRYSASYQIEKYFKLSKEEKNKLLR